VFLAYPELGIMASGGGLFRTMGAAAAAGIPVQVHCEDGELIEALIERAAAQGRRGPEVFAETRPPAAEQVAVLRALAVAELTGARPYITHLSSAEAVAHVRAARAAGRAVGTEACLHHVLLDAGVYRGEHAGAFLVAPPLRSEEHVEAVREALLDGTIDGVGSDHSQHRTTVDERIGPDGAGSYGIAGIGARMPLLLSWGVAEGVPIERLAHLLATGPAEAFGHAPRKGRLAVGSDGDLVVWDPDEEWTIEADSFPDGTGTSPYAGRRVRGRIRFVALRGHPLVRDARAVEPPPTGQLVVPHGGKGNGRD
jgi:dihydropyrimidinase